MRAIRNLMSLLPREFIWWVVMTIIMIILWPNFQWKEFIIGGLFLGRILYWRLPDNASKRKNKA